MILIGLITKLAILAVLIMILCSLRKKNRQQAGDDESAQDEMSIDSIDGSDFRIRGYESLVDLHTHTVASGHAYSSLMEMIVSAKDKGLRILGITEHGPAIPGTCDLLYFKNMWVVPRQYGDLRVMLGAELNILDTKGTIDLDEKWCSYLDIRLAGIHSLCWEGGTPEENTAGVVAAMHNPWVQVITHPADGTAELLFEPLVLASKETGTLLEINNNSLRPGRGKVKAIDNNRELLMLCKKHNVPVIIGSDAHINFDVSNHGLAYDLAEEVGFPEELILNKNPEALLAALKPTPSK